MIYPDIFLITSVINTGNKAWSYISTRSFFTKEERFEQTLHTIKSIRDLGDDSLILLSECSDLSAEMNETLKSKVDFYLQNYDNIYCRNACLNTEKKGYGELVKTQLAIKYLISNNIKFNRLFKISGRYYLNNAFNKTKFDNATYVFKNQFIGTTSHNTVLYSVPNTFLENFLLVLDSCEKIYKERVAGLEDILPLRCNPKKVIEILGASGLVAVEKNHLWSG